METQIASVTTDSANETKMRDWVANRGGIAVWTNKDLGSRCIGAETLTPAMTDGAPTVSPHWSNGNTPERVVTELANVFVQDWREVARVKVRNGPPCYGGVHKADRTKLKIAMQNAGEGATYVFDYSRNDGSPWFCAVVSVPSGKRSLA